VVVVGKSVVVVLVMEDIEVLLVLVVVRNIYVRSRYM
jgi:hypothetical protein